MIMENKAEGWEIRAKDGEVLAQGLPRSRTITFAHAYDFASVREEPVEIHGDNMVVEMDQHGQWHVVSRDGVPQ